MGRPVPFYRLESEPQPKVSEHETTTPKRDVDEDDWMQHEQNDDDEDDRMSSSSSAHSLIDERFLAPTSTAAQAIIVRSLSSSLSAAAKGCVLELPQDILRCATRFEEVTVGRVLTVKIWSTEVMIGVCETEVEDDEVEEEEDDEGEEAEEERGRRVRITLHAVEMQEDWRDDEEPDTEDDPDEDDEDEDEDMGFDARPPDLIRRPEFYNISIASRLPPSRPSAMMTSTHTIGPPRDWPIAFSPPPLRFRAGGSSNASSSSSSSSSSVHSSPVSPSLSATPDSPSSDPMIAPSSAVYHALTLALSEPPPPGSRRGNNANNSSNSNLGTGAGAPTMVLPPSVARRGNLGAGWADAANAVQTQTESEDDGEEEEDYEDETTRARRSLIIARDLGGPM